MSIFGRRSADNQLQVSENLKKMLKSNIKIIFKMRSKISDKWQDIHKNQDKSLLLYQKWNMSLLTEMFEINIK